MCNGWTEGLLRLFGLSSHTLRVRLRVPGGVLEEFYTGRLGFRVPPWKSTLVKASTLHVVVVAIWLPRALELKLEVREAHGFLTILEREPT